MTLLLITTLLLSGLGSVSSSVPRQFHVVKEQKSWTEAQQYCREKFTDLATIDDMTENEKVKNTIHEAGAGNAWIGLKRGDWQWSLADKDFYRENEAEFRNWQTGEPNGYGGEECVAMSNIGKWHDERCSDIRPFICYDGENSTHPYVLVIERKTWADAQRYCREKHTDLASVRNQTENDQQVRVAGNPGYHVWIGLFGAAWSDGSSSSFRHWSTGEPNNPGVVCTAVKPSGQWDDAGCHHPSPFICYGDTDECARDSSTCGPNAVCSNTPGSFSCACNEGYQKPPGVTITNATNPCQEKVKRQTVRVSFPVDSDVDMNDPAVLKAVLQQIQERLKKSGMPADAKLSWKKQPDGKIFKKEKEKKKEEGRRRRKKTEL